MYMYFVIQKQYCPVLVIPLSNLLDIVPNSYESPKCYITVIDAGIINKISQYCQSNPGFRDTREFSSWFLNTVEWLAPFNDHLKNNYNT